MLKPIIKKNEKLYCIAKCIKQITIDAEFVDDINSNNSHIIKWSELGSLNQGENIYYIKAGNAGAGFFAEFRSVINYLIYADMLNFIPVVEYSNKSAYYEDAGVNGIYNPFEYYFYQPSSVSIEQARSSHIVFFSDPKHLYYWRQSSGETNGYHVSDTYLDKASEIVKKYIKCKPEVLTYIEQSAKQLDIKGDYIGVHVRGGDFKRGYKDHPKFVSFDKYIAEVENLIESENVNSIFLATDDEAALSLFKKRFGNRLYYYDDVKRTDSNKSVIFIDGEKAQSKYVMGLEVLRDMWMLAKSKCLVAGLSQVATCAQMFNRAFFLPYVHKVIIDFGISKYGPVYRNCE